MTEYNKFVYCDYKLVDMLHKNGQISVTNTCNSGKRPNITRADCILNDHLKTYGQSVKIRKHLSLTSCCADK